MPRFLAFFCLLLISSLVRAQAPTLKDAAQKAVLSNPEVQQRWHAYKATQGERDAAFGGYLPRLDLSASKGRENRDDPLLDKNFTRQSTSLTLTQMLYDGFATRNEVRRFDHALTVRLFELQEASETAALEAARAYIDVLRYRKLVGLAEENYVQHRSVFEQIQKKVQAGVGRRVDLEQAAGRLALAEANLLTETTNLHDVSARYMRVVGEKPGKEMEALANLTKAMPKDMAEALRTAQQGNPALLASVENVRSAQAAARVRDAAYQPRFDIRLKQEHGRNLNGYSGQHDNSTAEVVMSWNLFSGFSDRARSQQYAEQYNVARDVRDKTCRDIRQVVAIAFNDTRKLTEQLGYLDQHQLSIEKARDAYRKQFDIGQRTLLDLLDSENELFQARRAYSNAEHDLGIAYLRTHAGLGSLLATLGISRAADQPPTPESWAAGEDAPEHCPPDDPLLYIANKDALNARALELLKETAPAPVPSAASAPVSQPGPERAVAEALQAWSKAWSGRNVQAYLDAYAPAFAPSDGGTRDTWAEKRKAALSRAKDISLDIRDIKLVVKDAKHASTVFKQAYRSEQYKDVVQKTLDWELIDGRWLIARETTEPLR
ncbi:MAG: TolC family outer membrane protein [Betaproteobacteria bacterium]|nr:TolC family outer membrane protein [Betaproteobacteria bacterium]